MISSLRHVAPLHAEPHRGIDDQLLDLRVGLARASRPRRDRSPCRSSGRSGPARQSGSAISLRTPRSLRDAPADVDAGEIAHRERPHREAELGERAVDVLRQRAFEQQLLGLDRRARDSMRLPTKPWQTPTTTGTLLILRPTAIAVASTSGAVSLPRTISSSFITLAGEKKCMPSTSRHAAGHLRDLVDVEIGGVGREHRAGLGDLLELAEQLLLDRHVLEHRLDHDVGVLRAR